MIRRSKKKGQIREGRQGTWEQADDEWMDEDSGAVEKKGENDYVNQINVNV